MESRAAVNGNDDDVAVRSAIGIRAHAINNALDGIVRRLIRGAEITGIARHFRRVLSGADAVLVGRVARLPRIVEEELMLGSVRLFDVNHQQIRVGIALDRSQGKARLVVDKSAHLIFINRLHFEVGKIEARAEPLRNAEIGLGRPETDVGVDVVDVSQNGEIPGDGVSRVTCDVDR